MLKILPILFLILAVAGFFVWRILFLDKPAETSTSKTTLLDLTSNSGSLEDRVRELEFSVTDLMGQIKELAPGISKPASSPMNQTSLDNRVATLETEVLNLKGKVTTLEANSQTAGASGATKAPVYIPLGWTGSSVATDWTNITNQEISIDPVEYSGYKNMQFEVYLRAFQGNGTAYARLANKDDGTTITSSEVSTSSQDHNWVTSGNFNVSSSKKTYRLQLKSLSGYSTDVQNARIKVSF